MFSSATRTLASPRVRERSAFRPKIRIAIIPEIAPTTPLTPPAAEEWKAA